MKLWPEGINIPQRPETTTWTVQENWHHMSKLTSICQFYNWTWIKYYSYICSFCVCITGRERGMFSDGTDTISFRLSRMSTRYSFTADMLMNGRIVQQEPFLWTRSYTRWMKRTSQILITCLTWNKIFKTPFLLLPIVRISAILRRWIENNTCSMEF